VLPQIKAYLYIKKNLIKHMKIWILILSVLLLVGCASVSSEPTSIHNAVFFVTESDTPNVYNLVIQFYVLDKDYNRIKTEGDVHVEIYDSAKYTYYTNVKEVRTYPKTLFDGSIVPAHEITIRTDELDATRTIGSDIFARIKYITSEPKKVEFETITLTLI
jgi:hypothetical protein